jgi:aspartate 1-decarboxylase
MMVQYLKSKIHAATITDAVLEYEGSIAIDAVVMEAAGLRPYEKVAVFNMENGNRFETYVIEGNRNSGMIGLRGPAALLGKAGQKVIIVSYVLLNEAEAVRHKPAIVRVDAKNNIMK